MRQRPRITKQAFRNWLVERQTAVVGNPGNSLSCPIAQYLTDFGRNTTFSVQVGRESIAIHGHNFPHPKWVADFVEDVDTYRAVSPGMRRDKIRGATALRILDTGHWQKR